MTAWRLRGADGDLRPEIYGCKRDALAAADHGDEAEEVEIERQALMILAPWLLAE